MLSRLEIARFLASAEIFRMIPPEHLETFAEQCQIRMVRQNEMVIGQGQPTQSFSVIRSGMIGLFARFRNQYLVPCEILGPARIFGLSAFLPRETGVMDAMAIMEVTVWSFPNVMLQKFMLENQGIALAMYQDLAHVLHRGRSTLVRALAGEEISFSQEETCPSERPTHFLFSSNTEKGEVRGMCQRRFECTEEQGGGCPMAGKPPQEFVTIWSRATGE